MARSWLGLFALVATAAGSLLILGSALFPYIILRGKRRPARGFDVLPPQKDTP